MKLIQLQYFKSVAETGNITKSAREIGITAAAISIAISNLEKDLGFQLFERSSNRVTLNDKGAAYYKTVTMVLDELERAEIALGE